MRNIKISFKYCILFAFVVIIGLASCKETYYGIDYEELSREELELLERYHEEIMANGLSRIDSTTAVSIDTIDHRYTTGLMMYHTEIGKGDSVKLFKNVGYRYNVYAIGEEDDVTYEAYNASNYYSPSPVVYRAYIINDGTSASQTGVPLGINEALLHMRLGGKSKVVLPSTIAGTGTNFLSLVYELEVTYIEQ